MLPKIRLPNNADRCRPPFSESWIDECRRDLLFHPAAVGDDRCDAHLNHFAHWL